MKKIKQKRIRINKTLKEYKGELVRIAWLDASCGQKEEIEKIRETSPTNHLVYTVTYGKLEDIDDTAITLLEEESDEECDYTVIPRSNIIAIETLSYKEELYDSIIKGGNK